MTYTHDPINEVNSTDTRDFILKAEEMYLDYFNNFLTIERYAEHYGLPHKIVFAILNLGEQVNQYYALPNL